VIPRLGNANSTNMMHGIIQCGSTKCEFFDIKGEEIRCAEQEFVNDSRSGPTIV